MSWIRLVIIWAVIYPAALAAAAWVARAVIQRRRRRKWENILHDR